jgi:RNA polymerase sigma-70 factor, ECF subfamily
VPDAPENNDLHLLVKRCNQGDRRAWQEFYARYYGMIRCAVTRHSRQGFDDAEDIIQEVFVHLFKALQDYDPRRPMEAYILGIARRVRISHDRKTYALKRGGGNPGALRLDAHDRTFGPEALQVASSHDDPETALMKAQETGLLRRALLLISEECRNLLALRYDEGLAYGEIAVKMKVREGTLRVRAQRCLAALEREYSLIAQEKDGSR